LREFRNFVIFHAQTTILYTKVENIKGGKTSIIGLFNIVSSKIHTRTHYSCYTAKRDFLTRTFVLKNKKTRLSISCNLSSEVIIS